MASSGADLELRNDEGVDNLHPTTDTPEKKDGTPASEKGGEEVQDQDSISKAAQRATESRIERFSGLSNRQKAAALLGLTDGRATTKELPPTFKLALITVKAKDLSRVRDLLSANDIGLIINEAITNNKEETINLQVLMPEIKNLAVFANLCHTHGVDFRAISNKESVKIASLGLNITSLDPKLYDKGSSVDLDNSIKFLKTGRDQITKTTPETGADLQAAKFPIEDISDKSLQAARKLKDNFDAARGTLNSLVIQINDLTDEDQRKVIQELSSVIRAENRNFAASVDQDGNIVFTPLTQRSGGYVAKFALDLQTKRLFGKCSMFIHNGETTGTKITDYRNVQEMRAALSYEGSERRILANGSYDRVMIGGRDRTTGKITTRPTSIPDTFEILDAKAEASFKVGGGPDKFIGPKTDLEAFVNSLKPDSPSKITILRATAGVGKSTLAEEASKELRNVIKVSIDPAGEGTPGESLINLADQLGTKLREKIDENPELYPPQLRTHPILKFSNLSPSKKSDIVTNEEGIKKIAEICKETFKLIQEKEGTFALMMDDRHHTDRLSDATICDIIREITNDKNGNKVGLILRPEERFSSKPQRRLETELIERYGQEAVTEISLHKPDGSPKLELSNDEELAKDYIFHCIPENLRKNPRTGQNLTFTDDWHKILMSRAETGLQMTNLVQILSNNKEKYLVINENSISLTNSARDLFENVIKTSGDIAIYQRDRIRKLAPREKMILACMAMIGSTLPSKTFGNIVRKTETEITGLAELDLDDDERDTRSTEEIVAMLGQQGYILNNEGHSRLQHGTFIPMILETFETDEKILLSKLIFEEIKDDDSIAPETKQRILRHAADVSPDSDTGYWQEVRKYTDLTLQDEKSHTRAYHTAFAVVGELNPTTKKTGVIASILSKLQETEIQVADFAGSNPDAVNCTITALKNIVLHGVTLGRFDHVDEACKLLVKAESNLSTNEIKEIYLAAFESAYVRGQNDEIAFYKEKLEESRLGLTPDEKLELDIKQKIKARNFQQVVAELSAQSIANPKIKRLFLRAQVGVMRKRLEEERTPLLVHGDVSLDPSFLSQEEITILRTAKKSLEDLKTEITRSQSKMRPSDELAIYDQEGEILGLLGEYQKAETAYREACRVAGQMELHHEAARAAVDQSRMCSMRGLVQVDHDIAHPTIQPLKNGTIIRQRIEESIITLKQSGLTALKTGQLDNSDFFQMQVRSDIVGQTATLIDSYQKEIEAAKKIQNSGLRNKELQRIKTALIPSIKDALKEFDWLVTSDNTDFPDKFSEYHNYIPPAYVDLYFTANMGIILDAISVTDITVEDLSRAEIPNPKNSEKYAVFSKDRNDKAKDLCETYTDNTGKITRTLRGLHLIDDFREGRIGFNTVRHESATAA